jgi:hypothetical protein
MIRFRFVTLFLSVTAVLAWPPAGCTAEPPKPVSVEQATKVTANVEAIDAAHRLITIKVEGEEPATIEAGPEVKNFSQIKVGDQVVVTYYEALAAEFKKPGEGKKGVDEQIAAGSAKEGSKPAAVVGHEVTATVIITEVDKKTHTVSFVGPYGKVRTVTAERPEGQEFVSKLKKGDEVEITYTEALALSVEPKPKK